MQNASEADAAVPLWAAGSAACYPDATGTASTFGVQLAGGMRAPPKAATEAANSSIVLGALASLASTISDDGDTDNEPITNLGSRSSASAGGDGVPLLDMPSAAPAVTADDDDDDEDDELCQPCVDDGYSMLVDTVGVSVFCRLCGSKCVMAQVRVLKKGDGTWKCLKCMSIQTKLYRTGGLPDFRQASQLDIEAFYTKAQGMHTTAEIEACVTEFTLKFVATKSIAFHNNGEFQPLGVWATRGYNTADIVRNTMPKDKRVCQQLGEVFRVRIMADSDTSTFSKEMAQTMRVQSSHKRIENPAEQVQRLENELAQTKKKQKVDKDSLLKQHKAIVEIQKLGKKCKNVLVSSADSIPENVKVMAVKLFTSCDELEANAQDLSRAKECYYMFFMESVRNSNDWS